MARTMIILWSWKASALGEGEWQVAGTKYAADRIVCRDWPAGDRNLERLVALSAAYENRGEVMIFMHRHHGYHQQHVETLSAASTSQASNYFLFGEGSDSIYLTHDVRGLLGTSGTFSATVNMGESVQVAVTAVADADRREIKATHFDYVWQLYQYALRTRIFELREDLFSEMHEILPRTVLEPGEFYQYLRNEGHQLILWRLLSFVGRLRKGSGLAQQLRQAERQNGRNLSFDDCGIRLQMAYGPTAADAYTDLSINIRQNLLAKGASVNLLDLRSQFDVLLEQIPGTTYH